MHILLYNVTVRDVFNPFPLVFETVKLLINHATGNIHGHFVQNEHHEIIVPGIAGVPTVPATLPILTSPSGGFNTPFLIRLI
jgi:hypothetical protein